MAEGILCMPADVPLMYVIGFLTSWSCENDKLDGTNTDKT